jgi:hypothetical protein
VIKKRGVEIDPIAVGKRLHAGSEGASATVVITRHAERVIAIICDRPLTGRTGGREILRQD